MNGGLGRVGRGSVGRMAQGHDDFLLVEIVTDCGVSIDILNTQKKRHW